jgi:hypothetical protein
MRVTWYVLEDGAIVDPSECATDGAGVLRHSTGVAVAKRGADAYASRSVSAEDVAEIKETKPEEPKRGYKTREAKAK